MEWDWQLQVIKQREYPSEKKWEGEWIWKPVTVPKERIDNDAKKLPEILREEIYPCAFCKGTGEKPRGAKCPVCKGKGVVSVKPPVIKCTYCKGRGEERPRTNITCVVCKGKGVVSIEEPLEICTHCRGTGAEPTNKLPCIVCRGKGVITLK